MFDGIYTLYVKYRWVRFIYQMGFFLSWASWASQGPSSDKAAGPGKVLGWLVDTMKSSGSTSEQTAQSVVQPDLNLTWLVFGWLPALFWPVEIVARFLPWMWTNYPGLLLLAGLLFTLVIAIWGYVEALWKKISKWLGIGEDADNQQTQEVPAAE